ncbi:BCCT family transporter [Flammeovirga aprica]|uniref:BCCT family transporter n=1 Tax=Flammeovirga aprica JL-4 TaxID=694437 RepID=A0A7X9RT96_9BACT|nr:BCCT family transporter [Flammeovirga aprica]NME68220.1 BCCT family transporter [Flammeovirga aprica JL-4]
MKHHVRSDKKTFMGIKANATVSLASIFIISILVTATLIKGQSMEDWFKLTQVNVSNSVGWFFILLVNFVFIYTIYLGISKFGKIKIGGVNAKADFSKGSWFAMLFSAGMGIGLLFWSVGEPISHFNNNPFISNTENPAKAAELAVSLSLMHWGFHAWSLYAFVGLALAFFTFNLKLPLTIRSIFHPIFGNKIYGLLGDIIDVIAVIATLFGLASSLGFGVQQINSGLTYLFEIPSTTTIQIVLITIITGFATLSLILGLDKGIRFLSEVSLKLAFVLLVIVIAIGPTVFLLKAFVQNIGFYLFNFFEMGFWTNSYEGVGEKNSWQNQWTIFYWAWWVSWSPFVGIFIARISKGRTIREFVFGVIIVPTLLTFFWFSIFGGSALYQELLGNHIVSEAVNKDFSTAIYYLLEQYPLTKLTSVLTIILVTLFFVTSSDSGSFVVDMLTSGGKHDAPKSQKVFWASMEGLIAGVLLMGGGLAAIQTATVLSGLPFALLIIVMCYSLYKAVNDYYKKYYIFKNEDKKEAIEV